MDEPKPCTEHRLPISEAERARRTREVNFARGSVRYEGGILPEDVEQLNARYIAGEIDSAELTAAILVSEAARTGDPA